MYFGGLLFPFGSFAFALVGGSRIEARGGRPKLKLVIARFLKTVAIEWGQTKLCSRRDARREKEAKNQGYLVSCVFEQSK